MSVEPDEGFLDQVFGGGTIVHEHPRDPDEARPVLAKQRLDRRLVGGPPLHRVEGTGVVHTQETVEVSASGDNETMSPDGGISSVLVW